MKKNIPVEKNKEYIVDIIDNGFEGEGIAKIDNFTIFIPGAIKGEKIKVLIVKVLTSHAFGKIIEIIEKSDVRQMYDCSTYKRCGGCNLRHIKYEETLKMKQNAVQSLVNKTLKNSIDVNPTIGMENPLNYRNKAQYPVGINKDGEPVFGVFAQRSHEIIPMQNCMIQKPITEDISNAIIDFIKENNIPVYNEKTGKGLLRHIVIKVGIRTDEVMCVLVINGKKIPKENELAKFLLDKFSNIKTIVKNINTKNTNVILGRENINIYGDGYITDVLGEYTFKISPLSFYQVNPVQAEKLYNIGVEAAKITKDDTVFDLYCGIGTISLFMAKYADTEIVLDDLINNKNIIPDVVMVDPPRRGLDNKSIDNILKIRPDRFVYISCNPATLVRDLAKFEEGYDIKKIQPVDMFPFTSHVECCALMTLKDNL